MKISLVELFITKMAQIQACCMLSPGKCLSHLVIEWLSLISPVIHSTSTSSAKHKSETPQTTVHCTWQVFPLSRNVYHIYICVCTVLINVQALLIYDLWFLKSISHLDNRLYGFLPCYDEVWVYLSMCMAQWDYSHLLLLIRIP